MLWLIQTHNSNHNSYSCSQEETMEVEAQLVTEEEAPLEGMQQEDSEEAACSAARQPQEQK